MQVTNNSIVQIQTIALEIFTTCLQIVEDLTCY